MIQKITQEEFDKMKNFERIEAIGTKINELKQYISMANAHLKVLEAAREVFAEAENGGIEI